MARGACYLPPSLFAPVSPHVEIQTVLQQFDLVFYLDTLYDVSSLFPNTLAGNADFCNEILKLNQPLNF